MEIKIYTMEHCPYCRQLKRMLDILKIDYIDVNIDADDVKKEYADAKKVVNSDLIPLIKIGDNYLVPEKDFKSVPECANIIFKKLGNR